MEGYVLPLEVIGLDAHGGADRSRHYCDEGETGPAMTPLAVCLLVSSMLFAVGLAGALTRRNTILVLVGIELMLNAANLNFVAFWRSDPTPTSPTGHDFRAVFDRRRGSRSGGWTRPDSGGVSPCADD